MKDKDNLDIRKRSIFSSSAESLTSLESMSISTQEQIYENIKIHKEIIQSVKNQPWSLSKKYKIVQKLKRYIAQHEDTLQERFAQSGNTFDLYARVKILIADKFKKLRREFWNFCSFLIPWEMRLAMIVHNVKCSSGVKGIFNMFFIVETGLKRLSRDLVVSSLHILFF